MAEQRHEYALEGYLLKRSDTLRVWRKRFFALHASGAEPRLLYKDRKEDTSWRAVLHLNDASVGRLPAGQAHPHCGCFCASPGAHSVAAYAYCLVWQISSFYTSALA